MIQGGKLKEYKRVKGVNHEEEKCGKKEEKTHQTGAAGEISVISGGPGVAEDSLTAQKTYARETRGSQSNTSPATRLDVDIDCSEKRFKGRLCALGQSLRTIP